MFNEIPDDRSKESPGAASGQSTGIGGAARRGRLSMRLLHGLWNALLDGAAVYGACAHAWPADRMD